MPAETPQILPRAEREVFPDCTALELAVKCKAVELWGL
jgi:phage tail protein X